MVLKEVVLSAKLFVESLQKIDNSAIDAATFWIITLCVFEYLLIIGPKPSLVQYVDNSSSIPSYLDAVVDMDRGEYCSEERRQKRHVLRLICRAAGH